MTNNSNTVIASTHIQNLLRYYFNNTPGSTFQDKLDYLNRCRCCARHQYNRPAIFMPLVENNRKYNNNINHICQCKCRHIARFICRQADNNITILPESPKSVRFL